MNAPYPSARPASTPLLQPGDHCAGHQIIRLLGTGRSAEVYVALAAVGDLRALKIMAAPKAEKDRARFAQEGEALAMIVHPNVVRLYDAGAWGDRVWLSMELVAGQTLGEMLRSGQRPPLDDALMFIHQACGGLAEAHRMGIVHRDLGPESLIVGPGGMVKVIDFGMAKMLEASVQTTADHQLGAARYLAPELGLQQPVTPRSDVYSLGLLLYEVISGEHPMGAQRRTNLEAIAWHLRERPRPLREVAPWISSDLADLVHRACARDPADRPASVEEIRIQTRLESARLRVAVRRAAYKASPLVRPLPLAATVPLPVAVMEAISDRAPVRNAPASSTAILPAVTRPEGFSCGDDGQEHAPPSGDRAALLPGASLGAAPATPHAAAPAAPPAVVPGSPFADRCPARAAPPPAAPQSTWPEAGLGAQSAPGPMRTAEVRSTDVPVESEARRSRAAPRRATAVAIGAVAIALSAAAGWTFLVRQPPGLAPSAPHPAAPSYAPAPSAAAPSASASAPVPAPAASPRTRPPAPRSPGKTPGTPSPSPAKTDARRRSPNPNEMW